MEKTLKRLRPAMLKFMREKYDEADIQRRWAIIEELDEKWLAENGNLGGGANMMSMNIMLCYAMCAFYEAVDRDFGQEDMLTLVNDVMRTPFRLMDRFDMNKLEKKKRLIKFAHSFMERYRKKSDRYRGNKWGNTWEIRVNPEGRDKGFAFTLYTCPLYEFAQKYGYMDFLPNMCAMDQLVASKFHAKLIRHNTLSDGDGCCEYWYVGDRSPEALTDIGSK